MLPFDNINTIEELVPLLESSIYIERYRIELEIERDCICPTGGIITDNISGSWQYGKGGTFKSSKEAIITLRKMISRFEEMMTRAYITIWNGSGGTTIEIFNNNDIFLGDFGIYITRHKNINYDSSSTKHKTMSNINKNEPSPKILCNKCFQPVEVVVYDIGVFVEPCECVINDIEERLTQAYEEGYDDGEADFKCED